MAAKTLIDSGVNSAGFRIARDANGVFLVVDIAIEGGGQVAEVLRSADIAAATTAQERTSFLALLGKLYDAALTKAGFN